MLAQGNTCSTAISVSPSTGPIVQTFNLMNGNVIWFSFNGTSDIDLIEAFHSNLSQKVIQIDVYSTCGGTLLSTVSFANKTFLQRHLKINSSNFIQVTWNQPNSQVKLIFQKISSAGNACLPAPDVIVVDQNSNASNLFPTATYTNPFTGKVLVKANSTLIMDQDIFFDNCEFVMEYGSTILMGNGYKLKITNSQLHGGCEYMWEGIYSDISSELFLDNVMIQDAYKGLVMTGFPTDGARFQIYNSVFNNNLVGAEIRNLIGNMMKIQNCIFTSRQITSSQATFPSVTQLKANNESQLLAASEISLKAPMAEISRGYCGIFTQQMFGLWIDGGSLSSDYNLFDRLAFGIISFIARTRVTNCHFQNLEFGSGKPEFPMDHLPIPNLYNSATLFNRGVGIAADGISTPDHWLYVGDGTSLKSCTFKNCASAGISTSGLFEKRILLNSFHTDAGIQMPSGGNYGIKIMNENLGKWSSHISKTHIISNHITNSKHAIAVYQSGIDYNFADLKIYHNLIDGTPGIGIELAATNTNFYPGASSNNYPMDKTIYSNTILNTKTGIKLSSIKVVPGASNTHFYINNNTISLNSQKTGTSASTGIDLISCKYIDVINNTDISGTYSMPVSSPFHKGVKHTNSPNCIVSCNSIHHVDQAFVFEGACLPTVFTNNYMSNCYDGVVLNYSGIIGDQGSEPRPSDNYWNPTPGSFGNFKTSVYNSQPTPNSIFWVRPNSGYKHSVLEDYAFVQQNKIVFQDANGALVQCSTNNNSPASAEQDELDRLARDTSTSEETPEALFLRHKLIYDKMANDSLFADTASASLRDYFSALADENVGALAESEILIQNREYLQAQLIADAVIPGNAAEASLRSILISYCNWLLDTNYVLSLTEIESIRQIAGHCSAIYGDAVGIARTLLKVIENDETIYEYNCIEESTARKASSNKNSTTNTFVKKDFLLSPNPASNYVNINSGLESPVLLRIINNQGHRVFEKTLNSAEYEVNLRSLPNGVYSIQLLSDSGKITNTKLIIIHE